MTDSTELERRIEEHWPEWAELRRKRAQKALDRNKSAVPEGKSFLTGRIKSWSPVSSSKFSAIAELHRNLVEVRRRLVSPPKTYAFKDLSGFSTVCHHYEQVTIDTSPFGGDDRDLHTAFNKWFHTVFPAPDGLGDLCYRETDRSFHVWDGHDWRLFGYRI